MQKAAQPVTTKSQKVHWAGLEFTYLEEAPDFGKLAGGFVYGFVKAYDAKQALKKITLELRNQFAVEVKEVEFVSLYDIRTKWETEKETKAYLSLHLKAETSGNAVFDAFHSYKKDF